MLVASGVYIEGTNSKGITCVKRRRVTIDFRGKLS